jgi:uncharacterized membrane protein
MRTIFEVAVCLTGPVGVAHAVASAAAHREEVYR